MVTETKSHREFFSMLPQGWEEMGNDFLKHSEDRRRHVANESLYMVTKSSFGNLPRDTPCCAHVIWWLCSLRQKLPWFLRKESLEPQCSLNETEPPCTLNFYYSSFSHFKIHICTFLNYEREIHQNTRILYNFSVR